MTVAGGGSGVSGVSKDKTQPLLIRHDSPLFTLLLGALEGSRRLELNAREGLGFQRSCISKEQTVPSIVELPTTDRAGLPLLLPHLGVPSNLNGRGADNDGTCREQMQGL